MGSRRRASITSCWNASKSASLRKRYILPTDRFRAWHTTCPSCAFRAPVGMSSKASKSGRRLHQLRPCFGSGSNENKKQSFYESAEVKPPPLTFFFQFGPPSLGVPSTSRSHLRVPRLAVCGEAGNPEAIVLRIPSYLRVLMRPPGLYSGFRACGLVASSGVQPHRAGTTFYPS